MLTKKHRHQKRTMKPNAKQGVSHKNMLKTCRHKKYKSLYGMGGNISIRSPRAVYG